MASSSPVQLQLTTVLGVRSKLDSSIFFQDEHTVIYPAGNQFILTNVDTKGQRNFRCVELEHVDWILVHSGAALLAIVARGNNNEKDNTIISFYDLHTNFGKRKRTFELRETRITITSLAFSHDAKHLAVLECGNREYTLSIWLWQKSRLIASVKLGQADGVTVLSQVLFHPSDNNLLSIIGRRYCRMIRHIDGNLRVQPSSAKLDQYDFISHAWYDSNRFIAGTSNGHVCVLFNGDVQTDIDVIEGREKSATIPPRGTPTTPSTAKGALRSSLHHQQQEHLDTSRPTGEEVTSITIVSKGFFCLVGGKRLCLYSKIADSWDFAKTREYAVPDIDVEPLNLSEMSTLSLNSFDKKHRNVNHSMWKVVVSPGEEHVFIMTNKQQIYSVSDLNKDQSTDSKEPVLLELPLGSFHQSAIHGLDMAIQKPLFVTAGDDHTIRLWNYESNTIEQMKSFNEPIYAIAIHPSGHSIVVAFSSKICLMNVLIESFSTIKEFPIHAAHEIKFSNGGHLFAAIDSNIIQIISPIYLRVECRLNHGQTIKEIHWKKDDLSFYSLSSNYFVTWNLETQAKTFEFKPGYRLDGGFCVDREDKSIYLGADDGSIRTIYNGQLINEIKLPQEDKPSCLEIFPSNGALLCGTHRGSIYVIKTPLTNTASGIFYYLAHSARVNRIVVAFHEALIISCCEDGILMLWSTQVNRSIKSEDWSPVVLQRKSSFLDLSNTIETLRTEEGDLKRNHEYQLRQMETNYLADIQRRTDMSENERRFHEKQIEHQIYEKDKAEKKFYQTVEDLREKFLEEKRRIDNEDRERTSRELYKEEELIRLSQKIMEDNEFRLKATMEASANEIRDIAEFFTGKIRETENELEALRVQARQTRTMNEVERKNTDADVDDEQLKLKLEFEYEKQRLIENNLKLQKDFRETIERQVHALAGKEADQDASTQAYKRRIQENTMRVQNMTQEIGSLNNEIVERNQTIREKVQRMNDLELKNQELEKFQYVLNYKIDELTRLINPREEEIERMRNQLLEMASEREKKENELGHHRFYNVGQRRTLNAIEFQIERERQKRKECEYTTRRIKNDILAHFADVTNPQRVKTAVAHLFAKHVQNDNVKSIYKLTTEQNDAISEEVQTQDRQRIFLERTTSDLKTKLKSDMHMAKTNRMRILNENSLLLQELNKVREELKIIRSRIDEHEIAKETFDERGIHSIDALIQTLNSDAGNYAVRQRDHELVREARRNQHEILRLRQRVALAQAGFDASNQLEEDIDDENDMTPAEISILKFA